MSRFFGPAEQLYKHKGNKGVLRLIKEEKRDEAVERAAAHDKGQPCLSPTCPYLPGGPKHGVKRTTTDASVPSGRPSRSDRRRKANNADDTADKKPKTRQSAKAVRATSRGSR